MVLHTLRVCSLLGPQAAGSLTFLQRSSLGEIFSPGEGGPASTDAQTLGTTLEPGTTRTA